MKNVKNKISKYIFILLTLLFSSALCHAGEGYPGHVDDYVNDFAQVMDVSDHESVRNMLKDLEYQTGIEAVVVTINSVHDYGTGDRTIESFATNLFNRWGVGHKAANNGVLMLVAVKDRKCRIELGGGYDKYYDSVMKEIIDTKMLPRFKDGNYSRGIYEGSMALILKITKKVPWYSFYKWHILMGVLILIFIFAGISCMRSGKTGWGWVLFSVAGILLIFLLKRIKVGNSSEGFGGGSSDGGGASGEW